MEPIIEYYRNGRYSVRKGAKGYEVYRDEACVAARCGIFGSSRDFDQQWLDRAKQECDRRHENEQKPRVAYMGHKCCAEIGSIRNGWHECGRKATLESVRHIGKSVYYLYFCKRHEKRAHRPESALVKVSAVRPTTRERE